jgi:uridine kinase
VPLLAAWVRVAPPRCGDVRLVCIDGPAGSGKTTLAAALSEASGGAPVVHMDDLYEGWDQELGAALSSRVQSWLLEPWAAGADGVLQRYDWAQGRFGPPEALPPAPVVILEGCASAAAGLRARASRVVRVEADPEVRVARGVARDGAALAAHWRAWQAHEAAHFRYDGTRGAADLVLAT